MKKVLFSTMALFFAFVINAQEIEPKEALPSETSSEISALRLAAELVKYGYAEQSALPLINAMQIIIDNPTQSLEVEKEGEKVQSDNQGKKGNITLNFDEILASAKEFAEGDELILNLIASVTVESTSSNRGAVNGPKYNQDVVSAYNTDTYKVSFINGRLAEIGVSGDGDSDLDLYVYDSNGNLIASDTDYSDDCYVNWVPRWTGAFIIKIVNRGGVANRYVLVTN